MNFTPLQKKILAVFMLKMQALCDLAPCLLLNSSWTVVEQVLWNVMKMAAARFSEKYVNVW
jgi:hypothetical protein